MPIESWIFLGIALACIVQAVLFSRDFFSPLNIYVFSQSATMGVAWLRLDRAMTDWHALTWWVWGTGSFAFLAGSLVVRFSLGSPAHAHPSKERLQQAFRHYNVKRHFLFALLALLIFCTGLLRLAVEVGGITLLSDNLSTVMSSKFDIGRWSYVTASGPLVTLLFFPLGFKTINPCAWMRYTSWGLAAVSLAFNVLMNPSRGTVLFSLALVVIISHYLKKALSLRTVVIFAVLVVGMFIGLGYARQQYSQVAGSKSFSRELFLLPYRYIANNYWNLDYAMNPPVDKEIHSNTYGIDFFYAFTDLSGLGAKFRNDFHWDNMFSASIVKTGYYNTSGYLWEVYKDLWWPGIVWLPFLVGAFLTWLHRRWLETLNGRYMLFHFMLVYLVGWWWFTESYKATALYWVWALYLFVVVHTSSERIQDRNVTEKELYNV